MTSRPAIYPGPRIGGDPTYHGFTLGEVLEGLTSFSKSNYPGLRAVRVGDDLILEADLADPYTVPGESSGLPAGVVMDWAGSSVPAGWLACDGSAVSRTTYSALFTAIGTTFGAGNGSSTFNLPDFRGRFPIGVGTLGSDTYALGATGGSARHALVTGELPGHTHTITHDHTYHLDRRTSATAFGGSGDLGIVSATGTVSDIDPNTSGSSAANTGSTGSGTAHENRPPYLALTRIISTGPSSASGGTVEVWY